ncbi:MULTISPECIES: FAD/NAD(P)-binding protein [unclassified Aureimonas]|uniref:FAD/NAD(P)-binding protein n=1 Tax=unclassified Aureimonas TaxID=2615206 RepID=UPI0006FF2A88|nr:MULTISPECIES: FAD/NAD(P)-binding protein [unclassified Aureimonas]KQT60504.1 hypothetical protein ASG62_07620 [Aureimonas sp. Leaf427]KQT79381.1 hypothetical protein ASG54_10220 [Aureimonas sp. Leaf460]
MIVGHVIVIGGGASGVILAAHLLRGTDSRLRVTIVERRSEIGRGIAYSTTEPDHILNTRAGSMSAYANDTEHFWRWLLQSGAAADIRCSDPFCFVPRRHFASYLGDLVKPWIKGTGDGRLAIVQGDCTAIRTTQGGVAVDVDGATHLGHAAVLATGHQVPGFATGSPYVDAWSTPEAAGIGLDDPVLVLGTGLSMIDTVIQLVHRGHRGKITALSRRGQLPRVHKRNTPLKIDAADMPFGTDISYVLRWFRTTAAWATERGGDWRDVVDGVRPHTAALWNSLTPGARARFLRHGRTWWEVHRHRLPPESETRIRAALSTGRLDIVAGRFLGLEQNEAGIDVAFRRRGATEVETMRVGRVVDCTGILRDPQADPDGLIGRLIADGLLRADPLNIGIEVDDHCAVIGRNGTPSTRVFAVGPVTRARYWEITAVPDIRGQCASLAGRIASQALASTAA